MFVRTLVVLVVLIVAGLSTQAVAGACGTDRDLQRIAAQARAYAAGQIYFAQKPQALGALELDLLCAESPADATQRRADQEHQILQAEAYANGDTGQAQILATIARTRGEALMSDTAVPDVEPRD